MFCPLKNNLYLCTVTPGKYGTDINLVSTHNRKPVSASAVPTCGAGFFINHGKL